MRMMRGAMIQSGLYGCICVSAGRCVGSVWSSRMATLLRVRTVLAKYDLVISLSRQTQTAYISLHLFNFHKEIPYFTLF